jgi:hypothetical protein
MLRLRIKKKEKMLKIKKCGYNINNKSILKINATVGVIYLSRFYN